MFLVIAFAAFFAVVTPASTQVFEHGDRPVRSSAQLAYAYVGREAGASIWVIQHFERPGGVVMTKIAVNEWTQKGTVT